jgi:nucleoside phosphorylase
MEILIVDDNAPRYQKLIDKLQQAGVERESIDVVTSKNCALDKLEENKYDLLVLDILIPIWPEELDAKEQNSIDLLNEIKHSDELKKPTHIIGITADKSISVAGVSMFEAHTWQVVEYIENCDEWCNQLINCVSYISHNTSSEEPSIDLAIICALKDPELSEILDLPWNWGASRPINENTFINEGWFLSNAKKYTVAACHVERMGMVATSLKTSSIISILKPKVITMTGICAGIKTKTDYGDVIFAESVWDYQTGKHTRNDISSVFQISPHQLQASSQIAAHVSEVAGLKRELGNMTVDYSGKVNKIPSVYLAPMASGSAVIADSEYIKEITSQNRKVLGIDMEVYGMYYAAESAQEPKPKFFAMKSVCDHGDEFKGDDYQKFAAYTSARTLQLLMERFGRRFL